MIERNGQRMYTFKELMEIMGFGRKRLMEAMDKRILVPSDIEPFRGQKGFRYLFTEKDINTYAKIIGVEPMYDRMGRSKKLDYAKKEISAKKETQKTIYPQADEIVITADNVEEVFRQIQNKPEQVQVIKNDPVELPTEMYIVRIGKGYITATRKMTVDLDSECWMQKDCAETMAEMFGGKLMQIVAKEVPYEQN